jgi:hypothetical protein
MLNGLAQLVWNNLAQLAESVGHGLGRSPRTRPSLSFPSLTHARSRASPNRHRRGRRSDWLPAASGTDADERGFCSALRWSTTPPRRFNFRGLSRSFPNPKSLSVASVARPSAGQPRHRGVPLLLRIMSSSDSPPAPRTCARQQP